ncbi:MAG: rod shape-determining protein MreD [Alphaproteobacteria bacterium]|nr:rod shape-determining protein MreD [Alphaproteobacteria bacterium]
MMRPTASQRLDLWVRQSAPMALTAVLAVLSVITVGIPGYAAVVPGYTAMATFYWAVFRPDLQPASALFLIGILQDALTGMPLGLTAVSLLLLHALALSQRPALVTKPFLLTWLGFVVIQLPISIFAWLMMSALQFQVIGPEPVLFQYLVTVLGFPVVAWIFVRIHRYVVR